ncbi:MULTISPECIES: hypothetical protein [unclassified Arthrobacter]|uniref:hypothetical protein n=1 Tax=unclassified Arthrobacter TaxID=235627 RepID=UPI003399DA92
MSFGALLTGILQGWFGFLQNDALANAAAIGLGLAETAAVIVGLAEPTRRWNSSRNPGAHSDKDSSPTRLPRCSAP